MKALAKVMMGVAALVLLTGCGPSKTTYDNFHKKAQEAHEKGNSYTSATLSGTSEDDGSKTTIKSKKFTKTSLGWQAVDGVLDNLYLIYVGAEAASVGENEDATYYAGNGFKYTLDGTTVSYNAAGLLTSYKSGGTSLTVKYSK